MATENQEVEENLDLPEVQEGEDDTTDYKAEAIKLREKAIAQRERTKELKAQLKTFTEKKVEAKLENKSESNDLDSGQKALMVAYGLKTKAEQALAQAYKLRTGDDVDTLMEDDIFQGKLAKLRETAASSQASAATAGGRTSAPAQDSVDFHLEKYESGQVKLEDMPFEMREQVLEKALKKQANASKFVFN
jgi:hypothetical protein